MEPWEEPSSIIFHASRGALLQMKMEKAVNEATKELMNLEKEFFQNMSKN